VTPPSPQMPTNQWIPPRSQTPAMQDGDRVHRDRERGKKSLNP
jgi:hypothetical protein